MKKILLSLIAVALFSASAVAQTVTDVAGDYQGKLYISLGEPINAETEFIDGEKVSLVANEDGTVDFKLKNFAFADMTLGDIEVNHLHLIFKGNFAKFSDVEPVKLVFNQYGPNFQETVDFTPFVKFNKPLAGDTIDVSIKGVSDKDIEILNVNIVDTSAAYSYWGKLTGTDGQAIEGVKAGEPFEATFSFVSTSLDEISGSLEFFSGLNASSKF